MASPQPRHGLKMNGKESRTQTVPVVVEEQHRGVRGNRGRQTDQGPGSDGERELA